ncbi:MAG TPA: BRCT domain-containing protein, partial [Bacteroidia bacterium]
AKKVKSMEALLLSSEKELLQIDEVGEIIAKSIVRFFRNKLNVFIVGSLAKHGLQDELTEEQLQSTTDKLGAKTFVISGVFQKHSRDELKDLIEKNGGKNTSSISGKTNYLLAGDNMGPEKLKKAEKLGVKLITEDEFLKMIE